MIDNPVFIVGTERSGSNLLRVLLNELPGLSVPHPPHLLRDLTPLIARYGDLARDENARRLVRDAVRLVRLHFAPWPMDLDEEMILRLMPARDLYSVYAAIYEAYRQHANKPRWGCKSTFMIHHVPEILRHHARPQFVHLVRDVRDVAVSARRSVFSHYHPVLVADLWTREQTLAAKWRAQLPAQTWHTVRYEDLLAAPEETMRGLCQFLGESYSPRILNYFERAPARTLAKLSRSWANVARPILSQNTAKYRRQLKPKHTAMVEAVARDQMLPLGYTMSRDLRPIKRPGPLNLAAQENLLRWMEEARALIRDRNARQRLMKKCYLLKLRLVSRAPVLR